MSLMVATFLASAQTCTDLLMRPRKKYSTTVSGCKVQKMTIYDG